MMSRKSQAMTISTFIYIATFVVIGLLAWSGIDIKTRLAGSSSVYESQLADLSYKAEIIKNLVDQERRYAFDRAVYFAGSYGVNETECGYILTPLPESKIPYWRHGYSCYPSEDELIGAIEKNARYYYKIDPALKTYLEDKYKVRIEPAFVFEMENITNTTVTYNWYPFGNSRLVLASKDGAVFYEDQLFVHNIVENPILSLYRTARDIASVNIIDPVADISDVGVFNVTLIERERKHAIIAQQDGTLNTVSKLEYSYPIVEYYYDDLLPLAYAIKEQYGYCSEASEYSTHQELLSCIRDWIADEVPKYVSAYLSRYGDVSSNLTGKVISFSIDYSLSDYSTVSGLESYEKNNLYCSQKSAWVINNTYCYDSVFDVNDDDASRIEDGINNVDLECGCKQDHVCSTGGESTDPTYSYVDEFGFRHRGAETTGVCAFDGTSASCSSSNLVYKSGWYVCPSGDTYLFACYDSFSDARSGITTGYCLLEDEPKCVSDPSLIVEAEPGVYSTTCTNSRKCWLYDGKTSVESGTEKIDLSTSDQGVCAISGSENTCVTSGVVSSHSGLLYVGCHYEGDPCDSELESSFSPDGECSNVNGQLKCLKVTGTVEQGLDRVVEISYPANQMVYDYYGKDVGDTALFMYDDVKIVPLPINVKFGYNDASTVYNNNAPQSNVCRSGGYCFVVDESSCTGYANLQCDPKPVEACKEYVYYTGVEHRYSYNIIAQVEVDGLIVVYNTTYVVPVVIGRGTE